MKPGDLLLRVEGLDAAYGRARVLFGVSLEVRRGEVVALMGRNGAGKSTTLKAVMGLVEGRRGKVEVGGRDVIRCEAYEIARLGLGYVPEERRVFTELTVLENLEVGRQSPRDGAAPWTPERLFALFPNLREAKDRPGGSLSGGEQQMLTIARTLMGNPRVLLLDEPSEGVAPVVVEALADAMLELKRQGTSILLSEQNLPFATFLSDRVYVLEKGAIRYTGTVAALEQDEAVRRTYLGV